MLVHVAEGPLDGRRSGGDEIYRFFRACADWPTILGPGQAMSVEVQLSLGTSMQMRRGPYTLCLSTARHGDVAQDPMLRIQKLFFPIFWMRLKPLTRLCSLLKPPCWAYVKHGVACSSPISEDVRRENRSAQARVRNCSDIPSALLLQARARDAICDAIRDTRQASPSHGIFFPTISGLGYPPCEQPLPLW